MRFINSFFEDSTDPNLKKNETTSFNAGKGNAG